MARTLKRIEALEHSDVLGEIRLAGASSPPRARNSLHSYCCCSAVLFFRKYIILLVHTYTILCNCYIAI